MTDPAYLLDANLCIYLIEGLSEKARRHVEALSPGSVVTSAVAFAETMRGIDPTNIAGMKVAEAFFSICPVLPFDRAAALRYQTLPFHRHVYDRLIAAHALALDIVFVTNNESDFADIPGLRVENWTR